MKQPTRTEVIGTYGFGFLSFSTIADQFEWPDIVGAFSGIVGGILSIAFSVLILAKLLSPSPLSVSSPNDPWDPER